MPLHWCCVARGDVILAQAGSREGAVDKLAKTITAKKPTAGWEFASAGSLKAVKLHIYATRELVWSASCVHDHESNAAKAFLEKILVMTEPLRESPTWLTGIHFAAQGDFGPMLQQRFDQANATDKVSRVQERVDDVKGIMNQNIQILLENHDKAEVLENKSAHLAEQANLFRKAGRNLKRFYLWQNAKFGAAAGTAVTAGTAIVVTPITAATMGSGVGAGVGLGLAAVVGVSVGVATTVSRNKKDEQKQGGGASGSGGAVHIS